MLLKLFSALAFAVPALAVVGEWGQCGGINYTGDTVCDTGLVCTYLNDYYYQCLKGTATTTTTTTTSAATPTATPTGYVKTNGTRFTVNGARFNAVGTNSYWVGLGGYGDTDMNQAFADMAAAGATVVRTWGFNDVTTSTVSNYPIYYQLWNGSTPTINTGATGLQKFDTVVKLAKANGLRLIVPLVNNWSDYGGMDVYVNAIAGSANHDLFYTNTAVKTAFKNYIKTFVSRYSTEAGIFAWELGNEPRCKGSTGTSTGTCTPATITAWATEISAYIKSIDANHLVAIGDEGFYNQPSNPSYPYQGGEGIDFDANLKISSIDFGTVHLYPSSWGQSDYTGWGNQWITDHATSMNTAKKPVLLEEFGVPDSTQSTVYTSWFNTVVSSGLTGDLIWQAGSIFSSGRTWDDGYAIYPDDPVYPLLKTHAAAIKARAT